MRQANAPDRVDSMALPRLSLRILFATMGIFRTTVGVASLTDRALVQYLHGVSVDTGAELTWVPAPVLESIGVKREKARRFKLSNGALVRRDIGFAFVHAGGVVTVDEVVFAEGSDATLLGARSIEGLNLRIDVAHKQFVNAMPGQP